MGKPKGKSSAEDIRQKLKSKVDKKKSKLPAKVCSLKELGQYSSTATCDIPKQCQTCSWYKDRLLVKAQKRAIDEWNKTGL